MESIANWEGQRILVTGGNGFVGRRLLEQAKTHNIDIHNLSLSGEVPFGVKSHKVDLRSLPEIQGVIKQVQPKAVLHLAAGGVAYGSADLNSLLHVNTLGLENLLHAVQANKLVIPVVIAGSGFEYAPSDHLAKENDPLQPFTPYGVSKAAASIVAQFYSRDIPITMLRLFSLYGVGEKVPRLAPYIIQSTINGRPVELTMCEQERDYTYVDDAAEAFWRVLTLPDPTNGLRVINISSGTVITLRTFVETLADILDKYGYTSELHFGARPYRTGESMFYAANINRMRALLCWSPTTTIEIGLEKMVEVALEQS